MADTLGSLRASVQRWLRGSKVDDATINEAINDGVESLFTTLVRASLSVLMGGPVTLSLAAATSQETVVSIDDPTIAPTVSDTAADDPALASHTVDVEYTYVTASGSETLPSPITNHTCALGFVAAVHPPPIVNDAIGWNCYARSSAIGNLVKQNDEPLPFTTTSSANFIEQDAGFTNDPADPEPPAENTTGDNIFYIRHIDVLTPSNVLRSWNQGDIDSDMMRRLSLTYASTSEYQNYGFDLINQRTLQIRPPTGASLTAKYYFIVKPRRMLFDNSPLPFPTVPSEEFLRCFALSGIFLALREINIAASWEKKADAARARCELALTITNRPRNQRVTAYRT